MDPHIFRAYDVRGIVSKTLTSEVMARIGEAFGTFLKGGGKVLIGRDVRTSSDMLESAFASGLMSAGVDVTSTGLVPIPLVNFKTGSGRFDGGAYITASHNPPEYNGVRLRRNDGSGYTGENDEVWSLAIEGTVKPASWEDIGTMSRLDAKETVDEYRRFLLDRISLDREVKAVLDIGNGAGFYAAPLLVKGAGARAVLLNDKPDGRFPNRPSEPNDNTLQELKRKTVEVGGGFGVGYDGDCDRAMFVDDKGRTVPTEKIGVLLARDIMDRSGPGVVVANVSCSMVLEEEVERLGGRVERVRVGDVFITEAIKKHKAVLGIETSAHIFMPEFYVFDDPILATLLIAGILSRSNEPLSSLVDDIPSYPYVEVDFSCPDEIKFQLMHVIVDEFKNRGLAVDETDGAKVVFEDGWILLRPSNTSPKVRAAIESRTDKGLRALKHEVEKSFEKAKKAIS